MVIYKLIRAKYKPIKKKDFKLSQVVSMFIYNAQYLFCIVQRLALS